MQEHMRRSLFLEDSMCLLVVLPHLHPCSAIWKNRDSTSLIYTLSNTVNRKDSIGHIRSSCEELAFQLGNSNLYFVKS
jgi:hypothetical protein